MEANCTIPIIIGITGHCALREQDIPVLQNAVKQEIEKLQTLCPDSRLVMMTCLAQGADMLCADVAAELGIALYVALPMAANDYTSDYPDVEKKRFQFHCKRAERILITPPVEPLPSQIDSDYLYRQADIYLVNHSHVLLALWDGGKPKESGCGAAETVDFALKGSFKSMFGMPYRFDSNEAVIHIFTPRGERIEEKAGTVHFLGNKENFIEIIKKTNEFNSLACLVKTRDKKLIKENYDDNDAVFQHLEKMYRVSDDLSVEAADKYRKTLALLAVASTIITTAFLLYDEAEALWMILVCGAVLCGAWFCHVYAKRTDCHRRYIEYRVLAETVRVQSFLRYAGSNLEAASLLPWSQQDEIAWVMVALCAINIGNGPKEKHDITKCWVGDQNNYHKDAYVKTEKQNLYNERIVKTALFISILLYVIALTFEILFGGLLFDPIAVISNEDSYRTILKLVLGVISAATMFATNYFEKLSPHKKLTDHLKMSHFYEQMRSLFKMHGQTEGLLIVVAHEELIENGSWYSFQKENTLDINL